MRSTMSAQSRRELLLALRQKYLNASWIEKKQLLDGFVTATGYHRKYAVALLSKGSAEKRCKRNKKRVYDGAVFDALLIAWNAANRICSKRLIPFLPSLIESLERFGHLNISGTVKEQLLSMSTATADRLLKPERRKYGKGKSTTKPGRLIRKHVPIRTFADWNDVVPGFLEGDLVAHCGEHVQGRYLNTLTLTDIATGWTELRALRGKSEADVLQEVDEIKDLLPFPLLGFDTDNGGEFLNYGIIDWCEANNITFTRSREYRKNDQAHVEEKNGSIVRKLIGYDRYEGFHSWQILSELYSKARLYINFFQPCLKLISKERDGARVRKRYDKAQTPYARMLSSVTIAEEFKNRVRAIFPTLDPVLLLQEMDKLQNEFWKTAVGATTQPDQSEKVPVQSRPEVKTSQPPIVHEIVSSATTTPRRATPARKKRPNPEEQITSITIIDMPSDDPEQNKDVPQQEPGTGNFAVLTETFFNKHLKKHSPNTINSYRDTFRLLHQFIQQRLHKLPSQLTLPQIDASLINAFLDDMETSRSVSSSSRNLRLSAIRSFCRFATISEPEQSGPLQQILAIPSKECMRHEINFLTRREVEALLASLNNTTWFDRRDRALITLAVETGMLVSELTALQPQDVDIEKGQVRIVGRGRKERYMPLNKKTLAVLKSWLQEQPKSKRKILFQNPSGRRLTSDGVRYILNKHVTTASEICPSLKDKQVTLFWLRHTKALELLQAGMDRAQVALWLGLDSAGSTQEYVNALALRKISAKNEHTSKTRTWRLE